MGTDKHSGRMMRIGRFVTPPEGSAARKEFDKLITEASKDPKLTKKLREMSKIAHARISAQLQNGAGFQMDDLIRDFMLEYNGRNMKYGLSSLPSSFNVLEAFMEYDPAYSIFSLRKEKAIYFHSQIFWIM